MRLELSRDEDLVTPYVGKQASYNLYERILKESFKYLPEDDDADDLTLEKIRRLSGDVIMTEQQKAHVAYRKFSGNFTF